MEKSNADIDQQQSRAYPPQSFSTSIHRKPLPATVVTTASDAGTNLEPPAYAHVATDKKNISPQSQDPSQSHPYAQHSYLPQTNNINHHHNTHAETQDLKHTTYPPTYSHNLPLPPLPAKPTLYNRLRRKWTHLRKRTRYLILGALLALLVLIVGLAAGLAHRMNRFTNLPLPNSHGGPYTGDLTYYDPGLGACGITSSSKDFIVAVSHLVYDAVQVGSNPNSNPLCGKKIRASRGGKSVDLTVVDRCTGCKPQDLDVTMTVFEGLADVDKGRVPVTWAWLQDVPGPASGS